MTTEKKHADVRPGEPPEKGDAFFRTVIPSDLKRKNDLIDEMIAALQARDFVQSEEDEGWARHCFDEALVNAIGHGNGYDEDKSVTVVLRADPPRWSALIADEGEGFAETDVPDPDDPDSLLLEGGRGILMMRAYLMGATHYRGGSALLMVKDESIPRALAGDEDPDA